MKKNMKPNGTSKFPDYLAKIDDNLTYFEITSSGALDILSGDEKFEDAACGAGGANLLKNITDNVSVWLPSEYTLVMFMQGPIEM